MKIPVHTIDFNGVGSYCKGGSDDVTSEYPEVVTHLLDAQNLPSGSVYLLEHDIVGEVCIYVQDKWFGYVSDYIKLNMDDSEAYYDYLETLK